MQKAFAHQLNRRATVLNYEAAPFVGLVQICGARHSLVHARSRSKQQKTATVIHMVKENIAYLPSYLGGNSLKLKAPHRQ